MDHRLYAACGCDIGRRRGNNEDNFFFDGHVLPEENHGLGEILEQEYAPEDTVNFCVFDGMGGQADGQVASHLAAATFQKMCGNEKAEADSFLREATQQMTDAVWSRAEEEFSNMGTTLAMLRFSDGYCWLCNVGDSRVFRFREGIIEQISKDHTDEEFLKEVGIQKQKPRLTQYIGVSPNELTVEPFIDRDVLREGTQYLICSDGLTDMVEESDIVQVLSGEQTPKDKVANLIKLALEHGGRDNVTVILIQVGHLRSSIRQEKVLKELSSVLDDSSERDNHPSNNQIQESAKLNNVVEEQISPQVAMEGKMNHSPESAGHFHAKRARRNFERVAPFALALLFILAVVFGMFLVLKPKKQIQKEKQDNGSYLIQSEVDGVKDSFFVRQTYSDSDELEKIEVLDANGKVMCAYSFEKTSASSGESTVTSAGVENDEKNSISNASVQASTAESEKTLSGTAATVTN